MQNRGHNNNGHNTVNSRPVSSTNGNTVTNYQKNTIPQQQNAYFPQHQQQQPLNYGLSTNQFINNNTVVTNNNNNNISGNTMMMRQQPQYPHTITNTNQTIQYHQPPQSQIMSSQKPYPLQNYSMTSIDNNVTKRGWNESFPYLLRTYRWFIFYITIYYSFFLFIC